jgi:hypothetical protein
MKESSNQEGKYDGPVRRSTVGSSGPLISSDSPAERRAPDRLVPVDAGAVRGGLPHSVFKWALFRPSVI